MIVRRSLGPKGQLVIPKDLREHLGLKEGSMIEFEVRDGEVVLKPAVTPEQIVEAYVGVVKRKLKRRVNIKRELEAEIEGRIALHRQ